MRVFQSRRRPIRTTFPYFPRHLYRCLSDLKHGNICIMNSVKFIHVAKVTGVSLISLYKSNLIPYYQTRFLQPRLAFEHTAEDQRTTLSTLLFGKLHFLHQRLSTCCLRTTTAPWTYARWSARSMTKIL